MKIVVGITGASGMIYATRLLKYLAGTGHNVDVIISTMARKVAEHEGGLDLEGLHPFIHEDDDITAPYLSGSANYDAMVVVPCSMATLGRIASGVADTAISRTADVFLKEKRRMILVPREAPYNLIHLRNMEQVVLAGAVIIPASPSFYSKPAGIEQLVDTITARILDHLGIENNISPRWGG